MLALYFSTGISVLMFVAVTPSSKKTGISNIINGETEFVDFFMTINIDNQRKIKLPVP